MLGTRLITTTSAPALGDLRTAGPGDVIRVLPGATSRKDWARIWLALGEAWVRGAEVVLMREESK
jgi:hypothetical protein